MQKLNSNVSFPEFVTWLLKMIHRPCCVQFHREKYFLSDNYTCQQYHHTEESVHLLMDERLVLLTTLMASSSI